VVAGERGKAYISAVKTLSLIERSAFAVPFPSVLDDGFSGRCFERLSQDVSKGAESMEVFVVGAGGYLGQPLFAMRLVQDGDELVLSQLREGGHEPDACRSFRDTVRRP
jgi:hypothetical protein